MTREEIFKGIAIGWDCNGGDCDLEYGCSECIEKNLTEYEQHIRDEYSKKIKEEIDNLYKYYLDGTTCSTSESIIGAKVCKDILIMIEDLKKGGSN